MISLLAFFLLFRALSPFAAFAQNTDMITSFLGQDHSYSVTFRGNGEAVVTLKAALSNLQDTPLSRVDLRVPRVDPKDIAVYQVIREPRCIRYEPTGTGCLEYQEPDYYQYWYGNAKYQKAQHELDGDTIVVRLPTPLAPNKSGSFIVYYRALGYAKKNLTGAYDFVFETLKVNDKIRTLQAGINTDSDIYLRGAQGKVNYRFEDMTVSMKSAVVGGTPMVNSQMDNFYQQIGQGEITKKAENLQPLESYTVKGSFADSRVKLYLKDAFVGLGIFLAIILIIALAVRFAIAAPKTERARRSALTSDVLGVAGISFVSSILTLGYTILLFFMPILLGSSAMYQYGVFVVILLLIISIGMYLILVVGPAVFMGMRRGLAWGIGTFAATILWLVLYLVVITLVLFLFQPKTDWSVFSLIQKQATPRLGPE